MQVAIIDDLAVCRQDIKEYLLRYIREITRGRSRNWMSLKAGPGSLTPSGHRYMM